jgi:carbon-monoxide dehydrogenase large subunit
MTMWCSTQVPHLLRTFLAPVLGIPEGKLTIIAPDLGGGFGTKCQMLFPDEVVIPEVSRLLRRPVKWIEDRYESLAAAVHSKALIADVDMALDADGRFLAFRGHFIGDGGGYAVMPWTPMVDPTCAATMLPSFYDVRNVAWTIDAPLTNKCPIGAVRGVGWMPGQLARETMIDDIARALQVDPIELRVKNAIGPEPYTTALGAHYDGGSYVESMRLAQKAVDYEALRQRQQELRAQGRYLGVGFSPFIEPTGIASKGALQVGYPMNFHDRASVTVEPDGSVTVTTGLHSHGQGHETVFAQVAADRLGVRVEDVRVVMGDTDRDVYGMGTYASRSAVVGTGAITNAAAEVKAKLVRLAGMLLEASPNDIELRDGVASVKGAPGKSVPMAQIAGFGYFGPGEVVGAHGEPALTSTRSYDPPENFANGTCVAVVEVDIELGTVKVERIVAVEDCGVMLNPMIVEGQVAGAVAQGLGAALLENMVYDDDGQFLSGSLMDYLYPTTTEVPTIHMEHIETPSSVTESGVKGVGEAGVISTPTAIVNAIADALSPFGVTIDRTPVTPSYIRDLVRGTQPK